MQNMQVALFGALVDGANMEVSQTNHFDEETSKLCLN